MPLHAHHGAKPEVHPGAWVAPGVHLIGDVYVAEGVGIWFGAVLRGDSSTISIGRYSNVQDNTVIHADPGSPCSVGEYVTVGHACIIHGCTVEDHVLLGMGAVVMNKARIGRESMLGARSLVSENKEIASRSLVLGIPGKVVREVTNEEVQTIRHAAEHYHELVRGYLKEQSQPAP